MVHISAGNIKLGKRAIPNISLVPVRDCRNSKCCREHCYALKSYRMYPGVRNAWNDNSMAFRGNLNKALEEVETYLKTVKPILFRWHVAGDILNQKHLDGIVSIAAECQHTRFLAFTKRFDLCYPEVKPPNLSIIYSMFPKMVKPHNPHKIPIAWVQDGSETRIPKGAMECKGYCFECRHCWHLKTGQSIYFNLH